jgi:hypothetical protein
MHVAIRDRMMRARVLLVFAGLLACDSSSPGDVDASAEAGANDASFDANACAPCSSSLAALCASDASSYPDPIPCPPDLDAPGFQAWAQDRFSKQFAPFAPRCGSAADCSESTIVWFNNGTDYALEYVFDGATKKLLGVANWCNGHVACLASDACLPIRCMSDGGLTPSSSCPPLPDGGVADASSD